MAELDNDYIASAEAYLRQLDLSISFGSAQIDWADTMIKHCDKMKEACRYQMQADYTMRNKMRNHLAAYKNNGDINEALRKKLSGK